jgi:hypothetical protein
LSGPNSVGLKIKSLAKDWNRLFKHTVIPRNTDGGPSWPLAARGQVNTTQFSKTKLKKRQRGWDIYAIIQLWPTK